MDFPVLLLLLLSAAPALPAAAAYTASGDAGAMRALSLSLAADSALGWSPSDDPCASWAHITCTEGRVIAIQIGNQSLSGTLPRSISKLTALTRLELQSNRISGDLPPLSGLTSLQTLLLHNNLFSSIPSSLFSGLTSLTVAFLDNNPFLPWQIPTSLCDAAVLVNFSANAANVSGTLPDFLATAFPSLDHLALAFNSLSGPVPAAFSGSGIRSLWLNNQRGGPGDSLSGGIAFLGNMTGLEEVWLHSNSFSGPLPDFSALVNLRDLQLRDNQFTGPVPISLSTSLKSLRKVTLTNNLLQGPVPEFPVSVKEVDMDPKAESFCLQTIAVPCDPRVDALLSIAGPFGYPARFAKNWRGNDPCGGSGWLGINCDDDGNIIVINFQKMCLNGTISPDFAQLPALQRLLLSDNNLTGPIPFTLTSLASLQELDVSDNSLSGKVPTFGKNVLLKTQRNPDIGRDVPIPSPASGEVPSSDNSSAGADGGGSKRKASSRHVGVIIGSVLAAVCGISLLAFMGVCYYKGKQQNFYRVQSPNATVIHPRHSGSDRDMLKIIVAGPSANAAASSQASCVLPTDHLQVVEAGNMVISIQVLRNVTNNFGVENVLGRGGFGTVYRGELHDGTKIAVKRMESGVLGTKGLHEFKSEIAVLTKVRHRNLVSLLGYCLDGNERLLVYEYMPQGTLSRHLFDWKEEGLKPLEWKNRLSISLDVARGVEYLHSLAHQSFIHRDLKPSNILLGDDMKAKVADFGLVRLADGKGCSVETRLAGTFGYLAPEYAVTGRVTTKSDVFSFGVILMELITGRRALDETQPEESVHLVSWFRRMQLGGSGKQSSFVKAAADPIIDDADDEGTLASIATVAELAGHCCTREPHQRPDMGHAVNVLSTLSELWKPSNPDVEESYGINLDISLPQTLKRWQAFEVSGGSTASSSFLAGGDTTSTSIQTRPPGFAESFTSADGR